MKACITFKTPDALEDAAKDCAERAREEATQDGNLSPDDAEELYHEVLAKAEKALRKFIRSGEYVTIEIDIDNGTAKVLAS